jgi:hypothetical protein
VPLPAAILLTILVTLVGFWSALLGAVYSGDGHDAVDRGAFLNAFAAIAPLVAAGALVTAIWLSRGRGRNAAVAVSGLAGVVLGVLWLVVMDDTI